MEPNTEHQNFKGANVIRAPQLRNFLLRRRDLILACGERVSRLRRRRPQARCLTLCGRQVGVAPCSDVCRVSCGCLRYSPS